MLQTKRVFAILFTALVFAAPVHADAGADLTVLMRSYREAELKLSPTMGIEYGDDRYADRYDENLTAAYMNARRKINDDTRAKLAAIDATSMNAQDGLSYEIFRWSLEDEARELQPGVAERFQLLAINQFNGRHITFAREMQWRADYPFTQARDYDRAIRRILGFTRWIDEALVKMHEGMRQGVVQPRAIVERMIVQVDTLTAGAPEASIFMGALKNMPSSVETAERERIDGAYREAVEGQLLPAYRKLGEFLKTEYLPKSRDSVGLSSMPGGAEMYLYLVKSETTSDLFPDDIHSLGLAEIARIETEMEEVKRAAGFSGSLDQFREFLRTDARFKFKDQDAMMAAFTRVKATVDERLSLVFLNKPRSPLTFRFIEAFAAPDRPAAEYAPASGDGRRPGIVYLNASDLSVRPTYTSEVLALHEGIPGHHLQLALARENRGLPRFRRFGGETAFAEGWALYAERLGPELGLYTDPYQKFGALSFDAWRASRLVVDTGIHWFNWSRERAITFLMAHTALSRIEASEEVDRYIAIPGQALSYKIGEQKILDLRSRAKDALGDKFDIRKFHDAVLKDGAMPLSVLDTKVARWIELERGP